MLLFFAVCSHSSLVLFAFASTIRVLIKMRTFCMVYLLALCARTGLCQSCMPLTTLFQEEDEMLYLVNQAIVATQLNLTELGNSLTMLLPTSSALQNVLYLYGVNDITNVRDPFILFGLRELLSYHIIPVVLMSNNFVNNMVLPTSLPVDSPVCGDDPLSATVKVLIEDRNITFVDDKQANELANVIAADLEVCEGVVHIIDAVLNPCCSDATHDCDASGQAADFDCVSNLQCTTGEFCSSNAGDGCKECKDCLFNTDIVDGDCAGRCGAQYPTCEVDLMNNQEICCTRASYDFCS
eukprot:TRINITY_DN1533_c0_g1_i2.p1 TRINITY_DN1533_c0_g1~~TRINITY_DN1533_c0_g1_i2.p1  ORF type:complete len:296 (-),score=19.14 TRINITY_DN1533_c0_g1_i2:274-1161(-)